MKLVQNGKAKVLVVDDMATNRALVKAVLEKENYHIYEAGNGDETLRLLSSEEFDVVLLDVMMPGMDGIEVCRLIRTELEQTLVPIIMVTALGTTNDIVSGMEVGANDYVTKPFNGVELRARVKAAVEHKRLTDRLDNTESVLFALARMVEAKDMTTGNHCDRLSHMCMVFGRRLNLSDEALQCLRRGGVLHDIGKLGIPDSILLKEGPLTDEEWTIMRQHTTIGAQLCEPLKSMRGTIDIVRYHHEKFNGSGYPAGLKNHEIPLLTRIFQIVDIYDALSTKRPYKEAFAQDEVVRIMEDETERGLWDPELMAVFLDIVRREPQSLVLSPGEPEDKSAQILKAIVSTGALDWDRKARFV